MCTHIAAYQAITQNPQCRLFFQFFISCVGVLICTVPKFIFNFTNVVSIIMISLLFPFLCVENVGTVYALVFHVVRVV